MVDDAAVAPARLSSAIIQHFRDAGLLAAPYAALALSVDARLIPTIFVDITHAAFILSRCQRPHFSFRHAYFSAFTISPPSSTRVSFSALNTTTPLLLKDKEKTHFASAD